MGIITAFATDAANTAGGAAAGATQQAGMGGMWGSLIMMLVVFVAFYFILIMPQKKRDKKVREMLDAVVVGDEIMTIGGIYGKIVAIKDDKITLETGADKNKIVMARSSIKEVFSKDE